LMIALSASNALAASAGEIFCYKANNTIALSNGQTALTYLKTGMGGNSVLMMPLESIVKNTGAQMTTDPVTKGITLKTDRHCALFTPGSPFMTLDGKKILLAAKPEVKGQTVFVPAEMLYKAFETEASWDSTKGILSVVKKNDSDAAAQSSGTSTPTGTEEVPAVDQINADYLKDHLEFKQSFARGDVPRFEIKNTTGYPVCFYKRALSFNEKKVYLIGVTSYEDTVVIENGEKIAYNIQQVKAPTGEYNSIFKKHRGEYRMHFTLNDKIWTVYFNNDGVKSVEEYKGKTLTGY